MAVDSQKLSHPDSNSVDSVDGNTFAVPDVLPLALLKRNWLLLSPWAILGLSPSRMAETTVALLNTRLLLAGLPLLALMLCLPALVMFQSLFLRSSGGSRSSKEK